jgi:hypothetical protein
MKPTVRYLKLSSRPQVGVRCVLVPLDHPEVQSQARALTSPVIFVQETPFGPEIETMNTMYVPLVTPEGFASLEDTWL